MNDIISNILSEIEADITSHRGLRQEWEEMDYTTREQIRAKWREILASNIGRLLSQQGEI